MLLRRLEAGQDKKKLEEEGFMASIAIAKICYISSKVWVY